MDAIPKLGKRIAPAELDAELVAAEQPHYDRLGELEEILLSDRTDDEMAIMLEYDRKRSEQTADAVYAAFHVGYRVGLRNGRLGADN